jgi:hypothetical protein
MHMALRTAERCGRNVVDVVLNKIRQILQILNTCFCAAPQQFPAIVADILDCLDTPVGSNRACSKLERYRRKQLLDLDFNQYAFEFKGGAPPSQPGSLQG